MSERQLAPTLAAPHDTLLVVLMALSSIALFAVFPYLALYLKTQFGLGDGDAGLAVGSIALISSCGAWFGGSIVDRLGWLAVLRGACLLWIAALTLLFQATRLPVVLGLFGLIGVCRLLMEPALKTALVLHDNGSGRLFKLRYMTLVAGAVAGPLLSTALEPLGPRAAFGVAGVFFVLYFALTLLLRAGEPAPRAAAQPRARVDWGAVALLVALGFLFFIAFSQYESTLSLRLAGTFAGGTDLYRQALLLNAALGIPLMLASDKLLGRLALRTQVAIGVLALAVALALLFGAHDAALVYLGATLFTLGEVILFPLPDIAAAKLSTRENRGRLMGLVDIRYLGFFVGPAIGGALLERSPGALVALLCGCALLLYPVYLLSEARGRRAGGQEMTPAGPPEDARAGDSGEEIS